jgi:transcriptional regulator with XRE-family HTH domain
LIYQNIVCLCKKNGISIAKLEKEAGIGNGTIGRWEKSSPSVDNLKKVADHFGVTIDSLIAVDMQSAGGQDGQAEG